MDNQRCALCGVESQLVASQLGVCLNCIRGHPDEALPICDSAHARARRLFDLRESTPNAEDGVQCVLCFRQCRIPESGKGYCGMRVVKEGRLIHLAGTPKRGLLHWYRDPLPTNCVADWVCSGHDRRGAHNLAVFYASCTLDCLFCQNWHYRETDPDRDWQGSIRALSAEELANTANRRTHCVCFFGGDPASQMPHALAAGKKLMQDGIVVCWETAGTMHPRFLQRAFWQSMESGGCIKFDLKALNEDLHIALTGGSNRRTLENFKLATSLFSERPSPPPVVASTLLVPGYVDVGEVERIASFIADQNPDIPYALLAFHPDFMFHDLPLTSKGHALEAQQAAKDAGLTNVRLGNMHLLSQDY